MFAAIVLLLNQSLAYHAAQAACWATHAACQAPHLTRRGYCITVQAMLVGQMVVGVNA